MIPPTPESPQIPDRRALIFILVTAFLNLAGVGLIGPVSPFLIAQYVANPDQAAFANGLFFTAYSFFQFLAVPGLGALSDRYGRRPVLLVCLLGSALGYLVTGIGGALWVLFAGRIIDGITGGNLGAIYAFIADITQPKERARYYGMIGAVSGLGFVVGPAVGGILAKIGGPTAPVYFAAAVTFVLVVVGYFVMPESLPRDKRSESIMLPQLNPFGQLLNSFKLPQLRWLLLAILFQALPFAALQSNVSVLSKDHLGWQAADVAGLFTVVGIVGIIVQGGLIRPLVKQFGEIKLAIAGAVIMGAGFLMIVPVPTPAGSGTLLLASAVVFALGNGLITPSLTALLSQVVSPREQGRVQGGNQSVQAVGRVLGPLWGGAVYVAVGPGAPYWTGAIMFAVCALAVIAAIPLVVTARAQQHEAAAGV